MDETHQSRVSDAATTRKRRSSILKSQRPPRTPFSELEFNVATPTDTAKSRRVSFSRRTGIAEFVTNEATTTWKNFYEEHNKSLESSGNESGAKAPIGHIGQTMFDRQFQEVEAVDFITSLDNLACRNISTSLNNFTEQLASLEGISNDRKLTAPQNQFELSALTEQQSKFFGDDLAIPLMGEMSGHINVNFSAVQNIGLDIVDDLDEIQRDLQTVRSSIVGPSSFRNDRDLSEYIEVELNSTHVGLRVEESDMSITETIPSPKVQNVSRANISTENKASFIKELDVDKENKCIPDIEKTYIEEIDDLNADMSMTSAIPTNIAGNLINEPETKETIVFDKNSEKRKTIIVDDELGNLSMTKALPANLLPIQSDIIKTNAYKLSSLEHSNSFNADSTKNAQESTNARRRTIVYERDDINANMSVTVAIPQNIYEDSKKSKKRNTIVFGLENADMSITMAVPQENIKDANKQEKRRTILFNDEMADLSMTKPIPAKLLSVHKETLGKSTTEDVNLTSDVKQDKGHVIVSDNEMADLSMTKPISAKLHQETLSKSITDAITFTSGNKQGKRHTIVFDNEMADLSMTKPISAKLLSAHMETLSKLTTEDMNLTTATKQGRRNTIVFHNEMADLSMTKPIAAKLLSIHQETLNRSNSKNVNLIYDNQHGKRHTIIFDNEMADVSMTKPIPTKLLSKHQETLNKTTIGNINLTSDNNESKRYTIVFDNEMADVSMTKPISTKLLSVHQETLNKTSNENINLKSDNNRSKRHTTVFDNEMGDISMTKPIPIKLLSEHEEPLNKTTTGNINLTTDNNQSKRHTIVFDNEMGDISMTKPIPIKLLSEYEETLNKTTPDNINLTSDYNQIRRHTIVFDNEMADLSMTKPISAELLAVHKETLTKSTAENINLTSNNNQSRRHTIVFNNEMADLSMTKPISAELLAVHKEALGKSITENINLTPYNNQSKRHTIVFDNEMADVSMTKIIPSKLLSIHKESLSKSTPEYINLTSQIEQDKRQTVVIDNEMADLSMTKVIPGELLSVLQQTLSKSIIEDINLQSDNKEGNTIVFDNEMTDLSMTKPISAKPVRQSTFSKSTIEENNLTSVSKESAHEEIISDRNRSALLLQIATTPNVNKQSDKIDTPPNHKIENVEMDMSITDVINIPEVEEELRKRNTFFVSTMSTGAEDKNIEDGNVEQPLILGRQAKDGNMSITMTVQHGNRDSQNLTLQDERKTIIFDDKTANVPLTKPIPEEHLFIEKGILNKSAIRVLNNSTHDNRNSSYRDFIPDVNRSTFVFQAATIHNPHNKKEIVLDTNLVRDDEMDMPVTDVNGIPKAEEVRNVETIVVNNISTGVVGKGKTNSVIDEEINMSLTDVINIPKVEKPNNDVRRAQNDADDDNSVMLEKQNDADISITAVVELENTENITKHQNRNTIVFDDEYNLSITVNQPQEIFLPVQSEVLSISGARDVNKITQDDKDISLQEIVSDANRSVYKTLIIQSSLALPMHNVANLPNHADKLEEMEVSVIDIEKDPKVEDEVTSNNIGAVTNSAVTSDYNNIKASGEGKSIKSERQDEDHKPITENLVQQENNKTDEKKFYDEIDISMTKPNSTELLSVASQIDDLCNADIVTVMDSEDKDNVYSELKRKSVATYIKHNVSTNVSIREAIEKKDMVEGLVKRKTITFEDDLSVAKSIKSTLVFIENEDTKSSQDNNSISESVTNNANKNIVLCKMVTEESCEVKIPPHLKNVSEEIKSLMNDLVKPMADVMPFGSTLDQNLKKTSSTCNTEIQTSLDPSSQIDLTNELDKNSEMFTVFDERRSLISSKNEVGYESDGIKNEINLHHCPSDNLSQVDLFNVKEISFRPQRTIPENTVSGGELIFDYNNPLNNVLLVPLHNTEVHKYNPTKSSDTLCVSEQSNSAQCVMKDTEVQEVSVHNDIGNEDMDDVGHGKIPDTQSFLSNTSKPGSIDQSIDAKLPEVKDTEVNTLIVMKGNTELLQASSSLTLVDDAIAQGMTDIDINTQTTNSQVAFSEESKVTSPVKVIYKNSENTCNHNDSDMTSTSNDEDMNAKDTMKSKKRYYSPAKPEMCKDSSESRLDVTPKPISKMQKISNSPNTLKNIVHCNKKNDVSKCDEDRQMDLDDSVTSPIERNKSQRKSKGTKKPGTSITVQQLLTEYKIDSNIDQKLLNQKILEALNHSVSSVAPNSNTQSDISCVKSPDMVSSFTSSKHQGEMRAKENVVEDCEVESISRVLPSEIDSSVSRLSECESSLNVVAKIDMLPFMGSHECEWESSGMDSWSFRVLHARLRLHVRLQHCHHNAARTRVRADTPVRQVTVQRVHRNNEDNSSVAGMCVGFAAEAIRRLAVSCSRAGDVPALLQAAAAAARQARRWGRAMHRARAHLAYKLTDHGLTLNVANIPLRCVWEVHMRLEMVFESSGSVPWPRATDVQAKNVLAAESVPETELKRALARVPAGWGHVPGTVWRIFKYLKNKTRDDEFLGI